MSDNQKKLGFVGDAALAAVAAAGLATNPEQQPDTNALGDSHQTQVGKHRDSIGEATRDQGNPSTSQS